jgi:tetratricopeptide (TPR) repeat protein
MFSQTKFDLRRYSKALVFSFIVVAFVGSCQTSGVFAQPSTAEEAGQSRSEILKKLEIASMQHDLILLLIENNSFDRVESEWQKVLDLGLNGKYEGAIAQSLLTISYKLSEAKQIPLAQRILDESLPAVGFSNKNRADILRFKAYLYKEAGDLDSAIDTLRRASELVAESP